MAKENVKKFFEEVSKNEDLQKQLKAASEKPNADMAKAVKA
ncbi:MAG: Nif11 family protein, partial [Treponema sp.]|nr:Nif11 family protein [Treponema sp.]